MDWMTYLSVAVGSAIGGCLRYAVAGWIGLRFPSIVPLGTMLVNVSGSLLIGWFAAVLGADTKAMGTSTIRSFWMAGFCGGYTTFSAFSLQSLQLVQAGRWGSLLLNVLGSVLLCLVGVWLGWKIGKGI